MTAILLYGGCHTVRIHPQGGFELLHGRRTAYKSHAVRLWADVMQVYLHMTADDKTDIWRTPYSENTPTGWIRTTARQTDGL